MTRKEQAERRKQIRAAVRSGMSIGDTARYFDVSPDCVYKAIRRKEKTP